jgi:hypothetical protein
MTIKAIASCRGIMRHCDHRRAICGPAGGNVNSEFTIFTGNANPTLVAAIARELSAPEGFPCGPKVLSRKAHKN